MTSTRACILPLCSLLCLAACGGVAAPDERIGEAASAASDYLLKIDGVDGESRPGTVWRWYPAEDGMGQAEIVTECEGAFCHLVFADAELQSSAHTEEQGTTTVWSLSAATPDATAWTNHLVIRHPPQSVGVLTKGVDVSDLAPNAAGDIKKPGWSAMAPAGAVNCVVPDCNEGEFPVEGWECLPVCQLVTGGGKDL